MDSLTRMAVVSALLGIAGCAVTPLDRAADSAAERLTERKGVTPDWSAAEAVPAPAEPLTLPAALTLAFSRNPEIRRQYARLGVAHADLVEAARIANPELSLAWLSPSGGGGDQTTQGIVASFSDLLLLPARRRLSTAEFRRVELDVASRLVVLARDVEIAWYSQLGALQVATLRDAIALAATNEAELARRFHSAGNISQLDLDLREAEAARAGAEALRARAGALTERGRLANLLGLQVAADWKTVEQLPAPPKSRLEQDEVLRLAMSERLDLAALREEVAMLEDAAGVARSWRLLGATGVGYERERETDGTTLRGPTLSLELPLFDQGQGEIERSEARLADARARKDALTLVVQNEVAVAHERLAIAGEIASSYQGALLPALESAVARRQEQVNFMLRSVFDLIAAKRDEYAARQAWLESVRDYWIARSALAYAAGGRLPDEIPGEAP